MSSPVEPKPAASLIVLRPLVDAFEVLILQRNSTLSFAPSNWVFPGGKIDEIDFNDSEDELLAAKNASVRECFEEAGLTIDIESIRYFSTWTAPVQARRRFRTHFFMTILTEQQTVNVDGSEIISSLWLPLDQVMQRVMGGEFKMMPPTIVTLYQLAQNNHPSLLQQYMDKLSYFDYAPKMMSDDPGYLAIYPGDSGWEDGDRTKRDVLHRLIQNEEGVYTFLKDPNFI